MKNREFIYMGKETYGSKVVTSFSLKPGTKFFDVLGKVYDKMKAKIQYYVRKDAVKRDERDVLMEFEVWARITKDEEGNDIQMFIKEDKRNGLRKDSSFYYDGYWEVLETDNVARTIKSQTSFGVKIVSLHDDKWRVTSNVMTNKYNDTVAHDLYFWKNGRLVKTIFNGVERNFVYGKTLQDTIKVVPHDKNVYPYHPGYNNSLGIMPDENDLEYKYFLKSPYSVYKTPPTSQRVMSKLLKQYNKLSIENNSDYNIIYKSPVFKNCTNKDSLYLYGKSRGKSGFTPNLNSKCQIVSNGCFLSYDPEPEEKPYIELYQSHIKWDSSVNKWREYCVTRSELDSTYWHEIRHIGNGRIVMARYAEKYMLSKKESFPTLESCESARLERENKFMEHWNAWKYREMMHCNGGNYNDEVCKKGNSDPKSPWMRPFKLGELCAESD